MTVLEILSSASALICENIGSETAADYSERTPYIMASFCTQCKGVDTKYRKAMGLAPITNYGKATMPLDHIFPLVPDLIPAATYYLAAMLVLDENEALSDKLYDLYVDEVATLSASLPLTCEKIVNKY